MSKHEPVVPAQWCLSLSEMKYFMYSNIENSKQLEKDISNQKFRIKLNPDVTKYKITTDNAFKVYIRQKHESLVKIFLCTEEPNQILKDQIKQN